ncbi:MAG: hypothetical protein ACHQ2F_05990, partial [Desulfobaccales bacterium]
MRPCRLRSSAGEGTHRKITIKLVDGSLIKGTVNLHHDEHMIQRVSEIFTQIDEPFLVIYDA